MSTLIVGGTASDRLAKAQQVCDKAIVSGSTGAEEIRELERTIATGTSVILCNGHKLTIEAQNAFLKTLEEPPEEINLILLAENEDQLIPTIVSRCLVINLEDKQDQTPSADLQKNLEKLKTITDRAEAISLIDQILLSRPYPLLRKLFRAKKYLLANTNVRLTLENLFSDC